MSGFVCYDTQLIVHRFEMGDRDFIYHSLDLFTDFVSLFRKILIILTDDELRTHSLRNGIGLSTFSPSEIGRVCISYRVYHISYSLY